MEAGLGVAQGVDLDDAAHFASIFGGDAGGVDGEGVDVIGFDFGAEAGRTIVGEGNAIDDELGLILGAAGMEDGIAFVEPAGLRVDEIGQRAAGERGRAVGDFLLIDMVGGAGAFGVEKSGLRGDLTAVLRAAMLSLTT